MFGTIDDVVQTMPSLLLSSDERETPFGYGRGLKPRPVKGTQIVTDTIALRYRNRNVVFEKSTKLIAVRARAGMAAAMQADVDSIAATNGSAPRQTVGAFEVVELRSLSVDIEQISTGCAPGIGSCRQPCVHDQGKRRSDGA